MSKWNIFKDNKPEIYDFVLVYQKNDGTGEPCPMSLGRYNGKEWELISEEAGCYQDLYWDLYPNNITHWMPLPERPKE